MVIFISCLILIGLFAIIYAYWSEYYSYKAFKQNFNEGYCPQCLDDLCRDYDPQMKEDHFYCSNWHTIDQCRYLFISKDKHYKKLSKKLLFRK